MDTVRRGHGTTSGSLIEKMPVGIVFSSSILGITDLGN